jgi:hypothetical protein
MQLLSDGFGLLLFYSTFGLLVPLADMDEACAASMARLSRPEKK